MIEKLFPQKGMGNLRLVVGALLAVAILTTLHILVGGLGFIYYPLAMILLIFPLYAAAQFLLPMMDPRDPDSDRFVVYGSLASLILIGFAAFGWLFLPAVLITAGLMAWRAPDLADLLPWMDDSDHQVKM